MPSIILFPEADFSSIAPKQQPDVQLQLGTSIAVMIALVIKVFSDRPALNVIVAIIIIIISSCMIRSCSSSMNIHNSTHATTDRNVKTSVKSFPTNRPLPAPSCRRVTWLAFRRSRPGLQGLGIRLLLEGLIGDIQGGYMGVMSRGLHGGLLGGSWGLTK